MEENIDKVTTVWNRQSKQDLKIFILIFVSLKYFVTNGRKTGSIHAILGQSSDVVLLCFIPLTSCRATSIQLAIAVSHIQMECPYMLKQHLKVVMLKEKEGELNGKPFNCIKTIICTKWYGPLPGPTYSSCGRRRPSAEAFFALRAKKGLIMLLLTKSGIFWCPVTLVPFSSNLSNFERKPKKQEKKSKLISKSF